MGVTNQLTVDNRTGEGILRTWRTHDSSGKISFSERRVPLTEERRKELLAVHERVVEADRRISRSIS